MKMSKKITAIINTEAEKRIDEFRKSGYSEAESIEKALLKIRAIQKENPLIAIFWEIEKALVIKLENNK